MKVSPFEVKGTERVLLRWVSLRDVRKHHEWIRAEMTPTLLWEVFLKPLEWWKWLPKLFQRCVKERNLSILIAAGWREHSLAALPFSTPRSCSLPLHPSLPIPACLQCPRSPNQRLHNVEITQYKSRSYASLLLSCPAEHRALKWCVRMRALNGREREEWQPGPDWGGELMSGEIRRRQCCRINMFKTVTDVDTLRKRTWWRTAPQLLFLFPFTFCHFLLQPSLCQLHSKVHYGLFPPAILIYGALCQLWVHHYVRLFPDATVTMKALSPSYLISN